VSDSKKGKMISMKTNTRNIVVNKKQKTKIYYFVQQQASRCTSVYTNAGMPFAMNATGIFYENKNKTLYT
jgi:hypothetical protein